MEIRHLSKEDAVGLLEIIHQSLACSSADQITGLMGRLGELLPYQAALSCLGRFGPGGEIENIEIFNVDYPSDYLDVLAQRQLVMKDPVVCENFRSFRMQYWADTLGSCAWSDDTHAIISLAEDFGFARVSQGVGYAHGVRNGNGTEGSFFCYHGLERSPRTEEILGLVIPHFHAALSRLAARPKALSPLTPRETEILKWAKEGKSNWEISTIMGISERTVKFHLGNLMHKLDASTRTHAVAIALEMGFVPAD